MSGMTEGREVLAGFRPRTTGGGFCGVAAPRAFCFGKRTQNQGRPGVALWMPLPRSQLLGCGTRFAQTVLAPTSGSGPGRSCALRRHEGAAWDGGGTKGKGKGNDAGSFT